MLKSCVAQKNRLEHDIVSMSKYRRNVFAGHSDDLSPDQNAYPRNILQEVIENWWFMQEFCDIWQKKIICSIC